VAYDATLLAAIDTAIASLVAGTRTVALSMGDKSITYGQTQLKDLELLRNKVAAAIAAGGTDLPSFILTRTSKGL
jgi:hypothetical protein